MEYIEINGERIPKSEAMDCVRMLCEDAKRIAGEYHGMNRSEKFRKNWPNEYVYADANWKYFIEAARALYAQRLADKHTKDYDKRRIHIALVVQTMAEQGAEKDPRIQQTKGTQQFEGDRRENRQIIDRFGPRSSTFKELLMSSSSRRFDA